MEQFSYTVKDKDGSTKKGIIEASTEKQAANILHSRGFTIISIVPKKKGLSFFSPFSGVGIGPLSQFTRQLATMISSGLPLTDSLVVLQKQTENSRLSEIIKEIVDDLQGGSNFSGALSKHRNVFSNAFINVVKAGEASGTLDRVLQKLADNLEKEREFKGKVKGAMVYPAIVVFAMILVSAIILIFVVPKLAEVYKSINLPLPLPTRILIFISSLFVKGWWLVIIAAVAGVILLRRYRNTPEGALVVDGLIMKMPVIGKLSRDGSLTEFTRTLSVLVAAGVPIIEALKIAGETATNAVHRDASAKVITLVEKGTLLSKAVANFDVFPPIIPQMISVGEETGKMDEVLAKVSHFFELEVDQQVKNLTTALEPFIMIALGIMVALLMISIIMPIYGITQAF